MPLMGIRVSGGGGLGIRGGRVLGGMENTSTVGTHLAGMLSCHLSIQL